MIKICDTRTMVATDIAGKLDTRPRILLEGVAVVLLLGCWIKIGVHIRFFQSTELLFEWCWW